MELKGEQRWSSVTLLVKYPSGLSKKGRDVASAHLPLCGGSAAHHAGLLRVNPSSGGGSNGYTYLLTMNRYMSLLTNRQSHVSLPTATPFQCRSTNA